jgi:putative membrane-bound dehydrogenase-like protein
MVRLACFTFAFVFTITAAAELTVGIARRNITPDYPIRLSGYGSRSVASDGVEQPIWAKALAFEPGSTNAAVIITVDNCGVPLHVRQSVLRQLKARFQLSRERLAIASSHTHNAPMLRGVLPNLFSKDLTTAEQKTIDRYTRELTGALVDIASEALTNRVAAKLSWGIGKAQLAENRRYGGGPTDDDLPVLRVTDPNGTLLAVLANYACHCTAISGTFNRIGGDWAGYAQSELEKSFPGATAMIAIGCGADQRPAKRFGLELSKEQGAVMAELIARKLADPKLTQLNTPPTCRLIETRLPFAKARSRDEWIERAKSTSPATAYHARKNLARLDSGQTLPTEIPYPVQSWAFGQDLLMVFLPGEVVVDYAVRLKREFDAGRVWVNAYANDVPCYIPSARVLREGGYEGETSMRYYDRPNVFATGVERRIFTALGKTIPPGFEPPPVKLDSPPPVAATDSTSYFTTKPGHYVQLVAAEPQVIDPVAIDFGLDGRIWVAEMNDYPAGPDGDYQAGGRIKFLTDQNGDGYYETATTFLDDIPFPTGVTAWGDGVLVCAAPDILYAVDSDADGKADQVRKLFSGFATDNYQARVNGIELGLDNWLYGSGGLRGGTITNNSAPSTTAQSLSSRDFRFSPDFQSFEPAAGNSQQGRVRDDWDNWFGNNNSSSLFGYPFPLHYRDRNPHVFLPADRDYIPTGDDPERIYPTSTLETRFNRPSHYNRVTSGCGIGIHRDRVIGSQYFDDAFICEPVHNVVRRLVLKRNGPVFTGHRAPDEKTSEFLSSRDNWFRPAQVKTGPDGALWVVDMYRAVIEHPRWIPQERLAKLDVRAGANRGRIYRVLPNGSRARKIPNLSPATVPQLVARLETPNGTTRDLIQRELVFRQPATAIPELERLFQRSKSASTRLYCLCLLDGLSPSVSPTILLPALRDADSNVRRHAIRIAEKSVADPAITAALVGMTKDPDLQVRYQLALSLGNRPDNAAVSALAQLAADNMRHPWLRTAVLSSAKNNALTLLETVAAKPRSTSGRSEMIGQLIGIIAATGNQTALGTVLQHVLPEETTMTPENWRTIANLQDALDRNRVQITSFLSAPSADVGDAAKQLKTIYAQAVATAQKATVDLATRRTAIRLAGRGFNSSATDLPRLAPLLASRHPLELQLDAVAAMARVGTPQIAAQFLNEWQKRPAKLRRLIISQLARRDEWIDLLLDAVAAGTVSPGEIDHLTRLQVSRRKNPKIVARAADLIPVERPVSRAGAIRSYEPALKLMGNTTAGAEVFRQNCASCHALNGIGVDVGPELGVYRNKNARDLLTAILDPNSVIEPRFTNYEVDTRDGETHAGIIKTESSAGITLQQAQGITLDIRRADIVSLRAAALSLMPEGLEQTINRQQMVDLIAFLQSTP